MKYCIHADCIIFRYDVAMFFVLSYFLQILRNSIAHFFAAEQQDICRQCITKDSFSYIVAKY